NYGRLLLRSFILKRRSRLSRSRISWRKRSSRCPASESDPAGEGEEAGAAEQAGAVAALPDAPEAAVPAPEESGPEEAPETTDETVDEMPDETAEGSAVEKADETPDDAPVAASPTQTPADVDERTPAELAAAAQEAEAAEEARAAAETGETAASQPARQEVAIGPPRPLSLAPAAAPDPARLRLLGLTLGMLTERMRRESPPQLGTALARLVDSDQEAARAQLTTLALSLLGEDQEPSGGDGQLSLFLEEALEGEVARGFSFSSMPEFQQALGAVAPELRTKLETIVWAGKAGSVGILTTDDVETLERVAVAMATALILDTSYDVRRSPGPPSDPDA
ncbi:MAG: hypothetical protein ACREQM_20090, partial [Candidatus Dormibacteraceae bacterium]